MTLVLGYISALAYWRSEAVLTASASHRLRLRTLPDRVSDTDRDSIPKTLELIGTEAPLHVLTSQPIAPSDTKEIHAHTWSAPMPPGALVECEALSIGNIFASSPEFTFLQLAQVLSIVQLIEIGYELCGAYSLTNAVPEGFVSRKPLTTVRKLRAFLEKASGFRGIKHAKRALDNVLPGSESPRETAQCMLLCLPHLLGGYKLGRPVLNRTIQLGKRAQEMTGLSSRRCDLYWPDKKLAVEYDSDAHHTGSTRIARDSKRRNELSYLDITVVTITRKQLNNMRELHEIAVILSKHLGKRLRPRTEDFVQKQLELRATVLSSIGPHKPKPRADIQRSSRDQSFSYCSESAEPCGLRGN